MKKQYRRLDFTEMVGHVSELTIQYSANTATDMVVVLWHIFANPWMYHGYMVWTPIVLNPSEIHLHIGKLLVDSFRPASNSAGAITFFLN